MILILIRRFARPDREAEFLRLFAEQRPRGNPDFLGETLTRLSGGTNLPPGVPALFEEVEGAVTYLNIARWRSFAAFERQFAVQLRAPGGYDPEIEVARGRISVLEIAAEAGPSDVFGG